QPLNFSGDEIYDATFSSSHLVIATTSKLSVYSLPQSDSDKSSKSKKKGKGKAKEKDNSVDAPELSRIKVLDISAIPGVPTGSTTTFRAARFHPVDESILYAVFNSTAPRAPKAKSAKRQAYIAKWKITTEHEEKKESSWVAQLEKLRKVGDTWVTCLDASPNGKLLALGQSDYSLCFLDTMSLAPLLTILKAHEFPVTTIRFNPTSRLLVSGSADCSLRIVSVPEHFGGQSWTVIMLVILALLVVLLAMVMQK
ncbi:hypothetical protein BJ138DRAFT_1187431, partial [Hygrophoropsis aurantiaca]